jgi:hypothetical protein
VAGNRRSTRWLENREALWRPRAGRRLRTRRSRDSSTSPAGQRYIKWDSGRVLNFQAFGRAIFRAANQHNSSAAKPRQSSLQAGCAAPTGRSAPSSTPGKSGTGLRKGHSDCLSRGKAAYIRWNWCAGRVAWLGVTAGSGLPRSLGRFFELVFGGREDVAVAG